nr:hypothetical protein [Tanacetum cinerariifolium]
MSQSLFDRIPENHVTCMYTFPMNISAFICHEPNSEGSGSAWKAYMNVRVVGLFLMVLLEYLNRKGVVRATSRGLDMKLHWSGVGAAPLMSPRQDETSEPLLYVRLMAGPYQCKDATRGRNDKLVTSGIRAKSDRGGPKQNHSSCSPKKFFKVLAAQRRSNGLIQMVDDSHCTLDLKFPERGVVRATSRGLNMELHWSGVGAAPLMSPRQDETSEPLLYVRWMAGPYQCKDATRGRNDELVTSGIRAKSDRGGPKQNHSSCSPKKFFKV